MPQHILKCLISRLFTQAHMTKHRAFMIGKSLKINHLLSFQSQFMQILRLTGTRHATHHNKIIPRRYDLPYVTSERLITAGDHESVATGMFKQPCHRLASHTPSPAIEDHGTMRR